MEGYIAGISFNNDVDSFLGKSIIVFFSGSNFKYPFSFNGRLFETRKGDRILLKEVKRLLKERGEHSNIIFTGGEPLLQKEALLDLLQFSKKEEMKVIIETNGSKPRVLEKVLKEKLADKIIFTAVPFSSSEVFDKITKSSTFFVSSLSLITSVKESLNLLKTYKDEVDVFFQTPVVPSLLYRKEHFFEIANQISEINGFWFLQKFSRSFNKPYDSRFTSIEEPSDVFVEELRKAILKKFPTMNIETNQQLQFPFHEGFSIEVFPQ